MKTYVQVSRLHLDGWAERLAQDVLAGGARDDLLSDKDLAALAHTSVHYWKQLRLKRMGPPHVTLSPKVVRTPRGTFADWLKDRVQLRASDYLVGES